MTTSTKYPFIPSSTSYLLPGQYWSIPLTSGSFACGRVLQLKFDDGKQDRRLFLAGLIDWIGHAPPTPDVIGGRVLIAHGCAHIRTMSENDGEILGCLPLEFDNLDIPLTLDSGIPSHSSEKGLKYSVERHPVKCRSLRFSLHGAMVSSGNWQSGALQMRSNKALQRTRIRRELLSSAFRPRR